MGSSGLICSGSFTPTCSLPPSSAAAALNNTWRDVLDPHLLFFSALGCMQNFLYAPTQWSHYLAQRESTAVRKMAQKSVARGYATQTSSFGPI